MGTPEILRIGTEVDLAGAAQIEEVAERTTRATRKMSDGFAEAGRRGESEFMRARGAAMLLGHEIGVPLNRHLIGFIAQIQGIQGVLAASFSAIAIIGLIEWVIKLAEHFTATGKAVEVFSESEKKAFNQAITDAKELRRLQEDQIKAVFELQIAQSKSDIEKQALRIREASVLTRVNEEYSASLQKQLNEMDAVAGKTREFAKAYREASDAQTYAAESFGDTAGLYADMLEKRAAQISQSKEYIELQRAVAEANVAITQSQAHEIEQASRLSAIEVEHEKKKEEMLWRIFQIQGRVKRIAEEIAKAEVSEGERTSRFNLDDIKRYNDEIIKSNDITLKVDQIQLDAARAHSEALRAEEQSRLQFQLQMGLISEDEYDRRMHAQLEATHKEILDELALKKASAGQDKEEQARIDAEMQRENDKYNQEIQRADQKALEKKIGMYKTFFNEFNHQFVSALDGWLRGTERLSQAFRKMFADMLMSLINFITQWILKKIEMWILDKIFSDQMNALTATTEIASQAAVASAAAFADAAMLGPAGLAAAPGMAAAAYGTVMAMEALVPRMDVGGYVERSGVAVVHKGEGVLTEKLMGAISGGGLGTHHTYNLLPGSVVVHAPSGNVDATTVVKILKKAVRDGAI